MNIQPPHPPPNRNRVNYGNFHQIVVVFHLLKIFEIAWSFANLQLYSTVVARCTVGCQSVQLYMISWHSCPRWCSMGATRLGRTAIKACCMLVLERVMLLLGLTLTCSRQEGSFYSIERGSDSFLCKRGDSGVRSILLLHRSRIFRKVQFSTNLLWV